jgi:hypothetical protein
MIVGVALAIFGASTLVASAVGLRMQVIKRRQHPLVVAGSMAPLALAKGGGPSAARSPRITPRTLASTPSSMSIGSRV